MKLGELLANIGGRGEDKPPNVLKTVERSAGGWVDAQKYVDGAHEAYLLGKKSACPVPTNFFLRCMLSLKHRIASESVRSANLNAVVADLRRRLEALEQNQKFCGAFQKQLTYSKHNSVVFNGGLWIALRDDPGHPGDESSGWQLAVRAGRDR